MPYKSERHTQIATARETNQADLERIFAARDDAVRMNLERARQNPERLAAAAKAKADAAQQNGS